MVKLAPQIPLTEPISVPASLPVGPEPEPGQVRQDSIQRKLGIQFQQAYWSDNPARYIQEIMPTQYASSANHYLPTYISNRSLYDLLDEMADKDSTIGGTENTVASQVLAREQRVDAPEGVDAALANPVVEFVRECISRLAGDWTDALKALLIGSRRHGFAVSEIVYRLEAGRYVIGRIEHRHPGQFDFDTSGALLMNNGTLDRLVVPPDRFILHRNAALYGMPYGQSEIFPLRWAYYFKKCALKAWADGVETFGLPIIVGTIGENLSEKDRRKAELEEIFQALRASSGVVVQEGITIDGVQRGLTQSATPHQALVDYLDRVMVRRLTGSTLTTMENGGTGSLAQAKTHGQVADDRLVAICNALAETITRDVIKPLVRINFGPMAPVPRFVIDTDDSADIYPTLAIISKAAEMGVPVSVAQFREWFGLKPPQDEADTMRPVFIGGGGQPGMDPALAGGALPFSEPHPDGCRCGCGTGAKSRPFFFAQPTPPLKLSSSRTRRVVRI